MKITTETSLITSLKAKDNEGNLVTSFVAQPYLTGGVYCCIEPGTHQITVDHKKWAKWCKGSIAKMEANGLTITTSTSTYGRYFNEQDIKNYIN